MRLAIGTESTTVEVDNPEATRLIILAHGAGTNLNGRLILRLRDLLVGQGYSVARFNFLYKELGKSIPDKMPRLLETYAAVAGHLRETYSPDTLICGGHSMGGRTASMLAAEGFDMDGLLMFAYPLHPAGKPDKLRDEHLPKIAVPALCFSGTEDELCTKGLMEAVLPRLQSSWTMHWIESADHSLHVPRSSGRSDEEVFAEIGEAVDDWAAKL